MKTLSSPRVLDAGFKAICTHRSKARRREPADFVNSLTAEGNAAETCSRGNGCTLTNIPAAPAGCPLAGGLIQLISNVVLVVDSPKSVIESPRSTDSTQNPEVF